MEDVASLRTDHANRYLEMLCRHFGRRLKVTFDNHTGQVEFPFGRCALSADDRRLKLVATAASRGDLDKVEEVIANHLERYAFREHPQLEWHPASATEQRR